MSNKNLESTKAAAIERGNRYMLEFQALSKDKQIETIAQLMYVKIWIDPYGYPNGMPTWNELPLVDIHHNLGADQSRYLDAAATVYKMLTWKPVDDTDT